MKFRIKYFSFDDGTVRERYVDEFVLQLFLDAEKNGHISIVEKEVVK